MSCRGSTGPVTVAQLFNLSQEITGNRRSDQYVTTLKSLSLPNLPRPFQGFCSELNECSLLVVMAEKRLMQASFLSGRDLTITGILDYHKNDLSMDRSTLEWMLWGPQTLVYSPIQEQLP